MPRLPPAMKRGMPTMRRAPSGEVVLRPATGAMQEHDLKDAKAPADLQSARGLRNAALYGTNVVKRGASWLAAMRPGNPEVQAPTTTRSKRPSCGRASGVLCGHSTHHV